MTKSQNRRRLRINARWLGGSLLVAVLAAEGSDLAAPQSAALALLGVSGGAGFVAACALHGLLLGTVANDLATLGQVGAGVFIAITLQAGPESTRALSAALPGTALVDVLVPLLGMAMFGFLRLLWRMMPLTHDFYDSRYHYDDVVDDPPAAPTGRAASSPASGRI
ncbi:MAG: hypothetical protein HZB16_20090 [Armatimonadetes bacterium]|nr:hypothetical protein [Armatimonadota bacterium]